MYGFFVSGLSVIESFTYSLFAIASMLRSDRFPMQSDEEKLRLNPQMVKDKFARLRSLQAKKRYVAPLPGETLHSTNV